VCIIIKNFLRLILFSVIIVGTFTFSACFSPWRGGENGTLTLQLGGNASNRIAIRPEEQNALSYTITLTSSNDVFSETFPAGTTAATFEVPPGTWNVTVKGIGGLGDVASDYYSFPAITLRAYGEKEFTVESGRTISESITMFPAMEVKTGEQMLQALGGANDSGRKEFIFVSENITYEDDFGYLFYINSGQNVELRAEKYVRFERDGALTANVATIFRIFGGGTLTLGKEGDNSNYLHISGFIGGADQISSPKAEAPLIEVTSDGIVGGKLIVNSALISHNRSPGTGNSPAGILVSGIDAELIMNGGKISNNTGNINGGGIKVENNGRVKMYGGEIAGNMADNGGQVYVDTNGSFEMYGGIMSGKGSESATQAILGAGVYIDGSGNFKKTGGIIYGEDDRTGNTLDASSNGSAVYSSLLMKWLDYTLDQTEDLSTNTLDQSYTNWD
jgi:hypothetical protein